jgi:hypothetical protein
MEERMNDDEVLGRCPLCGTVDLTKDPLWGVPASGMFQFWNGAWRDGHGNTVPMFDPNQLEIPGVG